MNRGRRNFLRSSAFLGTGILAGTTVAAQHEHHPQPQPQPKQKEASPQPQPKTSKPPAITNVPVITPDLAKLPWKMENGVKVFHLTAGRQT